MSGMVNLLFGERPRVPRQHPEDDLQRSIVEYFRWSLPDDAVYFAVPNGGKRHAKEAARMVGLGVRAGIPDLCVIWRGQAYFVELKAARGVLSEHQRQMHRKLSYSGAPVMTCRTLACVEHSLREHGVPLRGSVAA